MAGDVAHKIVNAKVGVEGAAHVCPNGLQIVSNPPKRLVSPGSIQAVSDLALSGRYDTRFDDRQYYSA